MLRRAASLTSRRAAAAVRATKPIPTHVTVGHVDGASVGISLPEATIVPKLGEVLCPETYCKVPRIYVEAPCQKVISYSSSIIPALAVAPLTASISLPSIGTGLVGSSSLLEFGGALPTASIKPSYIPPSIIKTLPVAATLKPPHGDQSSSSCSTSKAAALLAGVGLLGALGEIKPSADCVQGPATPCECKNRVRLPVGVGYPADWVGECRARVKGTQPAHGDGVPRYGLATTCLNYNSYPELFLGQPVFGGVRRSNHVPTREKRRARESKQYQYSALTPWPILKEIMNGVDPGYDRVKNMFEVAFRHSDPLKTIIPLKDDTDPQAAAKAHYKELLQALVLDKKLVSFDIERTRPWDLTKQMRDDGDDGLAIAYEATQLGAVVGRLRPDLGKGDVEVILNEGQAKPLGEPRVRDIMTKTTSFRAHDDKRIWSFGVFPEYQLLDHLGLADRLRNFHAVVSVALGMNAQGQHRPNSGKKAPCPIAASMPMMAQMINSDLADVEKDPIITPYPHKAARKCLPSPDLVDDPTATLQVMGKVATAGFAVLKKRWPDIERWLRGEKVTPPSLRTGYTIWYDASEANHKYDAPVTEWPRFDPEKMKPKRQSSGKRKATDDEWGAWYERQATDDELRCAGYEIVEGDGTTYFLNHVENVALQSRPTSPVAPLPGAFGGRAVPAGFCLNRVEPWGNLGLPPSKRSRVEPSDWDELDY